MAAHLESITYDLAAQKWYDLAEKRRAYLIELQRSGRWKRYYTEQQFIASIRDASAAAETWARLLTRRRERKAAV